VAIKTTQEASFGETRELYVRLNNLEVSNHGVSSVALFRGYLSKEAFDAGKPYVFEKEVEFTANVALPLWDQAYAALKAADGFQDAVSV
jgi:hypothetical protein